jgi:transposase
MVFKELSDDEWALLSMLASDEQTRCLGQRGRPRVETRSVVNAVLWMLTTREPWKKLPDRYPSGPTCRRRIAAWRANGTLAEIVRRLSRAGRTFPYGLSAAMSTVVGHKVPGNEHAVRDDGFAHVVWKRPESWRPHNGAVPKGLPLDPIASMTHDLVASLESDVDPTVTDASGPVRRWPKPVSLGHVRRGGQIVEESEYLICVGAERLPDGAFRAWAEITKGEERLERSGLIGPRFVDADVARRYAHDWVRAWIVRQAEASAAHTDMMKVGGATIELAAGRASAPAANGPHGAPLRSRMDRNCGTCSARAIQPAVIARGCRGRRSTHHKDHVSRESRH